MTQVLIPRLEAAIAELRERPITGIDKGFGAPAPGATVSAAGLGARKPSLFGPGFTMPVLVLREPAVAHNVSAMAAYCAAKGGTVNLTRAMAIDHGKHNCSPGSSRPARGRSPRRRSGNCRCTGRSVFRGCCSPTS
jgi:NAD(P)-dependent dehydrogenase (short-subunit alcohol dehydrogenase family)